MHHHIETLSFHGKVLVYHYLWYLMAYNKHIELRKLHIILNFEICKKMKLYENKYIRLTTSQSYMCVLSLKLTFKTTCV